MNTDLSFIPQSPRNPTDHAKELIFRYQGSQKVMLILGISFLIMGLTHSGIFFFDYILDFFIDISPVRTSAVVESKDSDDETGFEITYNFYAEGRQYSGFTITNNYSLISDFIPGKSLPVEYSGIFPCISRIQGIRIGGPFTWRLFFLIFPVIGIFLTTGSVRSNRNEKKAYRYGAPANASIIKRDYDYSVSSNHKHPYKITWEFKINGEIYRGSLTHMDSKVLLDLIDNLNSEHESIVIVYLESSPDKSVPYI